MASKSSIALFMCVNLLHVGHEEEEKGAEDRQRGREKGASAAKTEKDGRSKNGKRRKEGKEEIRAIATTPSYSPNG